jgi:hypothetical protein
MHGSAKRADDKDDVRERMGAILLRSGGRTADEEGPRRREAEAVSDLHPILVDTRQKKKRCRGTASWWTSRGA